MTDDQKSQLIAHLNAKWRNKKCQVCEQNNWQIAGLTMVSIQTDTSSLVLGGPVLPTAAMVCAICGNTLLFNLVVPKIIPGGAK